MATLTANDANLHLIGAILGIIINELDEEDDYLQDRCKDVGWIATMLRFVKRDTVIKIEGFFEEIVPLYQPSVFRFHFRVSPETFEVLVSNLSLYEELHCTSGGRPAIPIDKCLAIFLWTLATNETRLNIAERFNISVSTLHSIIHRIMHVTGKYLYPKFLKWPSAAERPAIVQAFKDKRGFPGVLGAVDGSHIPILSPANFPENYVNRKGFYSVVLQAVCDNNLSFIDCVVGWPGSVHDARILRNSSLYDTTDAKFSPEIHILGDSAYPLKDWLLTPFKDNGNLTEDQSRYNFVQSSTRMVVERSFGLLKGRFPILKGVRWNKLEDICSMILTTCVFHNICLLHDDDVSDYLEEEDEVNHYEHVGLNDAHAAAKRANVVQILREL